MHKDNYNAHVTQSHKATKRQLAIASVHHCLIKMLHQSVIMCYN